MTSFQSPSGTKDWLYPESEHMAYLVESFKSHVELANYGLILSPMFEDLGVFVRGVGDVSELVTKEMYEFVDKGGRKLALRPEGTASVMRAFLQHNPPVPFKAWYVAPSFRYERPQAGRYRQHHQVGLEAIGTDDPGLDLEIISILFDWLTSLGLGNLSLKLNCLGDTNCRPAYLELLYSYLEKNQKFLCKEHMERWSVNPLRVLDCKKPECVAIKEDAPKINKHLCPDCKLHFETLLAALDTAEIPYLLDDYLVRGLDYYTRTTFEVASLSLESAQNAVGGGGRYDNLALALGGNNTPGIGFASGLERVLLACEKEGVVFPLDYGPSVFVIDLIGGHKAGELTMTFRRAGVACDRSFDNRSLKSQLRQADKSRAKLALIVGEREKQNNSLQLKWLDANMRERFSAFLADFLDSYVVSESDDLSTMKSYSGKSYSGENKDYTEQYQISNTLPTDMAIRAIKEFFK